MCCCRSYADAIERRLRSVGVVGHQLPLSSPDSLPKALEDITRRGLLFSITVNEQNEQHRSLTLNILHGTPQGKQQHLACQKELL